jgi:hypothetical protein
MGYMFYQAAAFNKNISGWNVASVTPKPPTGFSSGSALTAQNSPVWGIYAYTSHTFTTADVSGRTGPTLSAVRTAYANAGATWASSHVNMTSDDGIQLWTVPVTGSYTIRAVGAGVPYNSSTGTNAMNLHQTGMDITITTTLTRGEVIKILVGQQPILTEANGAGGAGGTFVVRGTQTPIIVAGGGGGRGGGGCNSGSNANNAEAGMSGHGSVYNSTHQKGIPGGSGGNSGDGGNERGDSGGGGGLIGNGSYNLIGNGSYNGGLSFTNGGLGGPSNSVSTAGGFGGGGSGEVRKGTLSGQEGSGGGGGGYSGGGGGGQFFSVFNYLLNPSNPSHFFATSGGGGGSYILDGTTMTVNGYNSGHGYVQITYLSS